MLNRTLPLVAAFGLMAGSALAQEAGVDFVSLDADGSGELSMSEIQAAVPDITQEDFDAADADASGELSETEFSALAGGAPEPEEY